MTPGYHDEEILGKVYDSRLLRRLWPFLARYRTLLLVSLVLIPLQAVFEALPARFFAESGKETVLLDLHVGPVLHFLKICLDH